ncbi:hypothetical protein QGN29_13010 [Temperatibacter marinus]|uniref:Response regulatory domain-containing protein n=1 Tax=Temperatibacter marinus TaxID=1456591 RepID=A0AA52H8U1_9PROT|nr:hypothetical protein [Temperatibacter marinus]WND02466.1 hypothetical protein QGN29_13010 [Temperatibacter marinus]
MVDDILLELRNEAIDTIEDKLGSLNDIIIKRRSGVYTGTESLSKVRLESHSIKAVAASFDMKAILVLSHRFEDFTFDMKEISVEDLSSIQAFSDRIAEALEAFINDRTFDVAEVMRKLPAKGGFDEASITVSNIEVMLVMEPGIATKIVTRELLECGYRIVNVASTLDALVLIPQMKPDCVITSRVMPELTGIDLACALKAMPTTRATPVALIATDNKDMRTDDLPKNVPVIRKGSDFGNDVADVFMELGIL